MFNIKSLICIVAFFVFFILGVLETANSDPERYGAKIKKEITTVFITLAGIKCTEKTKSANSLELVAKENNKSLFAYVGSFCKELEGILSLGDLIKVSALLDRSEVLGIEKDGITLLSVDSVIKGKVENYSNYNIVFFVISLSFLLQLVVISRKRVR